MSQEEINRQAIARIMRALNTLQSLHVCDKVKSPSDECPVCAMFNELNS